MRRIQSSIIITDDLHGLITMARLAEHYEAQYYICRVKEEHLDKLQREYARLEIEAGERVTSTGSHLTTTN